MQLQINRNNYGAVTSERPLSALTKQ